MKEYVIAHKNELYGIVVTILWLVSEYLGQTEKFKASNVFQAIRNGISKLKAKHDGSGKVDGNVG